MDLQQWGVTHWVRELGRELEQRGYVLSRFKSEAGVLATRRGYWTGRIFPYTDFLFIVDLDAEGVRDGMALEDMHQSHREYGEGQMKVPRALRYRVPNSVTIGITAEGATRDMIDVAIQSRHAVNSGEKNSVYLIDLSTERLHSQGLEQDRFSRYGGTWSPNVNPSNRVCRMLVDVISTVMGGIEPPSEEAARA